MINNNMPMTQYKPGDLVYPISLQTSLCITRSRKIKAIYIKPLPVYKIIDNLQYVLMDIESKILNGIFHFNRHKQVHLKATESPVNTLVGLKQIINLGIKINGKNKILWMLCDWSNFRVYF